MLAAHLLSALRWLAQQGQQEASWHTHITSNPHMNLPARRSLRW